MDLQMMILAAALIVLGAYTMSLDGQRRRLEDRCDSLEDQIDDDIEKLALANTDPLTGSSFGSRARLRVSWRPRPGRRAEALRSLYSESEVSNSDSLHS